MTIDEAVAGAAVEFDRLLERSWDALALRMIEDGADPCAVADPPDASGAWTRVSFDWVLQRQRDLDLQWRAEWLVRLRAELHARLADPS